jgi:hypothetical protein
MPVGIQKLGKIKVNPGDDNPKSSLKSMEIVFWYYYWD